MDRSGIELADVAAGLVLLVLLVLLVGGEGEDGGCTAAVRLL